MKTAWFGGRGPGRPAGWWAVAGGLLAALGLAALPLASGQAPTPADPARFPEPGAVPTLRAEAVLAPKAMVATAHPLASRAALAVLRDGGNAIDGLLAAQAALNVVEPQSSGLGGGSFILFYDARAGQVYCLDGREEAPADARREDFRDAAGRVLPDVLTGGLPVGVPGTVAVMWLAHARWGRLPADRVLAPAVGLAEEGVGVTPRFRDAVVASRRRLLRFPASQELFLHADGSEPELGEVRKQPDLARTLRLLAAKGPPVFYEGEIAREIVAAVRQAPSRPGKLSPDDLKGYRAVYREPVRLAYRGYEVVSMPPPSSGGITLGLILGMLERADLRGIRPGSLEEAELLARTGAAAFADRNAYLGDQDWHPELDMRTLLDRDRVRRRWEAARQSRPGEALAAGPRPAGEGGPPGGAANPYEGDNTTHLSIVDADGNVVSCTTTIEHGMGSGLAVAGRGFLLNNQLTDFDLGRDAGPNALEGGRRPRRTALADGRGPGGKRPRSSMTPVIVFRDGRPYLALGSPGGSQIIGIVAQVLVNVLDHGMDLQQAINAARLNSQNGPLGLEAIYPARRELVHALVARGWKVEPLPSCFETWGGAQGVRIRADGILEGAADPRREGAARGY